jgi:serine/threonine protein phosphatase PrpC|eukprot:CAMPEP_0169193830 /NCGR_PEP_ID=MMETSP1016-20121227/6379_1 /TAXON_ID=342587 /ORGANISM="Karlodinium micrum, Strain CCMP2283" /LENGTH=392 /DNA_ID=CAMNT_0009270307 /DNA_START=31 /DNA_END=1209 /DNA_ORIENTATION=+
MASQKMPMNCFAPEVATGLNPLWSTQQHTLGALHAAAMGQRFEAEQQWEMHDMKARLGVLVELSVRQAEQQESMRKQMEEQTQLLSTTISAVRQVQSQVTAMRSELMDVVRGNVTPAIEGRFETQVRRRLDPKRSDDDEPAAKSEDPDVFAERVKARRGISTTSANVKGSSPVAHAIQDTSQRSRTVSRETSKSPQLLVSEEPPIASVPEIPSLNPDMSTAGPISENGRSDEDVVQVQPFGFNRSPPGLCLYSDEVSDEAWISEVANEIKNLIITNDDKCVDAVRRTSPQVLNKTDHDGMTILHYAAMHGNAKACEAIVSHAGFSAMTAGDRNSNTAMHVATLHDQGEVCHVLLSRDPSAACVTNRYGDTPHDIAQRRGIAAVCAAFQHLQQ